MIIIGEKLNSSIKSSLDAMVRALNGDDTAVVELICRQEESGAALLDVNTALTGDEPGAMELIVRLIQKHSNCGVMPDSPNIDILYRAARICGRSCLVNSFPADADLSPLIELMRETGCSAVLLPTESGRVPEPRVRVELAKSALSSLNAAGIESDRVYVDILSESLAVKPDAAINALETLRLLKSETDARTICGLSNISFGLPRRMLINSAFLASAIVCRLDAAILDPCRRELADTLHAANVVAGNDADCVEYINYVRDEYL